MIAVSLGGEGEPITGATLVVNGNLLVPAVMVRPEFARRLSAGHVVVRMSAGAVALRDSSVDIVFARHFPIQFNTTIDGFGIEHVANESFRVAKPGAHIIFSCSSCDVHSLAIAIEHAGFVEVQVDRHQYDVRGRKS